MKIGFLVNPLAGYGIVSNMKGSDGLVMDSYEKSRSVPRALRFLKGIKGSDITFYVPAGIMGSDLLDEAGISSYRIIYTPGEKTSADDTRKFVRELAGTDATLMVFVGGDGTARDILSSIADRIPMLGVPAGMKMYSSVFSISVDSAVRLMKDLSRENEWETTVCEVVDIDEDKYRKGELEVHLFGETKVPRTPLVVSQSKAEYTQVEVTGIREYLEERMTGDQCFIVGPGSTCKMVLPASAGSTNILGFDIMLDNRLVVEDADEETIYRYVSNYRSDLVISPIGGQNFLLGRGNKQISGRIVEKVGWDNIWVIASREKLDSIANLYVDINDSSAIGIPAYIKVLYGYGRFRMVPVER